MKIKPLFDRIVIKNMEAAETTKSGIVLPSKAQEKSQLAKVIAVGPGGLVEGNEVKMVLKVGDIILCSEYAGSDFKIDGEEVKIIRQSDVLAIVKK